MDVFEITHQTRPGSVKVFSKTARAQVTRLVAALAHHEQDNDDISRARVSEAQSGLVRVMELDEQVRKFRAELDNTLRMVQDRFYRLQDDLDAITPGGVRYTTAPQTKGTNYVQPHGQAKSTQSPQATGVSAGGNPKAIGNVLAPSTAARPAAAVEPETVR